MQPIRIGLVGAGNNTRNRHLPGLLAVEGVELTAVCNLRPESTRAVAREFNIPHACEHWREVVARDDVDAVVIGTWPYRHCEVTCAALEAGKHVMTEARMAMDASEARQMLAKSQQAGRVTQIVPSPIGMEYNRVLQKMRADGYWGQLREIVVRATSDLGEDSPLHWRMQRDLSGQNILMFGILVETVHRWFGYTRRLTAQTETFVRQRPDPQSGEPAQVTVPDSLGVLAQLEDGARCVYHISGVAAHGPGMSLEGYGSEGTVVFRNGVLYAARRTEAELVAVEVPAALRCEWRVEEEFIAAIRDGTPIELTTFEDGLRYMEVTDAVQRSADTGQMIDLG